MAISTATNPQSLTGTKPKKEKKQSYVKKAKILVKPKKPKKIK